MDKPNTCHYCTLAAARIVDESALSIAFKDAFLGFYRKGTDVDAKLPRNQVGNFVDDAHVVQTGYLQARQEGDLLVFGPFGLHDPVAKAG